MRVTFGTRTAIKNLHEIIDPEEIVQELAATEDAELAVLEAYLPQQLGDDQLERIVRAAVASTGATGMGQMGQVMKAAQGEIAGRADGGRVAAIVRTVLAG